MDISTYIIKVFCLCDDWLKGKRIRQRGPQPKLHDSEVLTMEIVGEFLGIDEEEGLFDYFRWHWLAFFPQLAAVHRTTFTRQAANLWRVKEALWQYLVQQIEYDAQLSIVDSFPQPICRFARASRVRLFEGEAAYGYDELAKQTYYGFRFHVRICWPGVIVSALLTPASTHDLHALDDLSEGARGWLLGDRNYWSPRKKSDLANQALQLLTPYKSKKRDNHPWPRWLVHTRRRIETVFSQLVGRFQAKTVSARDLWHLTSRWTRKLLSHTVAFLFAQQLDFDSPLQFHRLLS